MIMPVKAWPEWFCSRLGQPLSLHDDRLACSGRAPLSGGRRYFTIRGRLKLCPLLWPSMEPLPQDTIGFVYRIYRYT